MGQETKLAKLIEKGVKLPTLPAVGSELMTLINKPLNALDVREISKTVERDPSLAALILQVANSPYYGTRREVTQVTQAFLIIGLEEAIGVLNYHMLKSVTPDIRKIDHFNVEAFWQHNWACANVARALGQPQYLVHSLPGELYMAGLLHDIGKLVLAIHMPDEFEESLRLAHTENRPLFEAEREIIGVDHAELGGNLLENWNLPVSIRNAVSWHHDPYKCPKAFSELAGLAQFADHIALNARIGYSGNPVNVPIDELWFVLENPESLLAKQPSQQNMLNEMALMLERKEAMNRLKETAEPQEEAVAFDEIEEEQPEAPPSPPFAPLRTKKQKKGFFDRVSEGFSKLFH